jgi:hypothetical protein
MRKKPGPWPATTTRACCASCASTCSSWARSTRSSHRHGALHLLERRRQARALRQGRQDAAQPVESSSAGRAATPSAVPSPAPAPPPPLTHRAARQISGSSISSGHGDNNSINARKYGAKYMTDATGPVESCGHHTSCDWHHGVGRLPAPSYHPYLHAPPAGPRVSQKGRARR